MSLSLNSLPMQRAERLRQLLSRYFRQADDGERAKYKRLVKRLPALLRHNGLYLTLQFLADEVQDRKSDAAGQLLHQLIGTSKGNSGGLQLEQLFGALASAAPGTEAAATHYRMASQLASAEAFWIERLERTRQAAMQGESSPARQASLAPAVPSLPQPHPEIGGIAAHCKHPGLFWRFAASLPPSTQVKGWRDEHVKNTASAAKKARLEEAYRLTFKRRQHWLQQRCVLQQLTLADRLMTGVGEPTVFECQATLHPVTGMPRLNASGLHGGLAEWCFAQHKLLAPDSADALALPREHLVALLGNRWGEADEQPGDLIIHDAWWVPGSTRGPLEAERTTSHHPEYYSGQFKAADGGHASDFDSPRPTAQLAIAGGFLFAMECKTLNQSWAKLAMRWLCRALAEEGFGAVRQSGYGLFVPAPADVIGR